MCGICGIWNYREGEPVQRELLHRVTDRMAHRGPDDSGTYYDDARGIGLGFRRLAIIDLSPAGHQPMANEDETVWIAFNGEIYNFQELRPDLEARGHRFRSRSDTEVILHQYEDRGPDAIADLDGMFGLAIWDARRRRVLLARDRMGKKPLYYYDDGSRLIFASELKALLLVPGVPRQLDYDAVAEYLSLGYITSPRTIFAGVQKLPPAHVLIHDGLSPRIERYWDWLGSFQTEPGLGEREWHDRLLSELRAAVRRRMVSDVPLGAFLSGGVDSSTIVALMAESSDRPIKTFSIGFEDQDLNELVFAREVAQRFGTDHTEEVVRPAPLDQLLPDLVAQMDEPFADPSVVPTYYVTKIARQHVTVCLSGDGGDEAFAGYPRYYRALLGSRLDQIPPALMRPALALLVAGVGPHLRAHWLARRQLLAPEFRYAYGVQLFYSEQARSALAQPIADRVRPIPDALAAGIRRSSGLDELSRYQYLDGLTYLPEDILVKVDRTSMWNSLEVRAPLLDHHVLELAARIPPQLRLAGRSGKHILKQAIRGLVPDSVIDRPKQGFGIPGRRWLSGELSEMVRAVLCSTRARERGLLRPGAAEYMIAHYLRPSTDLWPQVWAILVLELWCQTYLDRSPGVV
jgi:asparagine synthase (glutamine-hydrolysing)